jgi:hypothetical protein
VQTAASRRMEQSASSLADGHFAAGMDEWEQPDAERLSLERAVAPRGTVGLGIRLEPTK